MPVSLPDSVERWRKLLALVAAGHLTQTMLPPTWVSLVFGRIVTEPIGHLIPASMLTACTCLSSASMLTFTGLNGEGMKHPFIRKVLSSAGFSYRDANNWLTTLRRHSRYDRACTELHPGEPSCTRALIRAMPRIVGVAVRDIATLYTLLLLRALGTGAPRPPIAPLARTLAFCVTAFSSIRVLSCSACAASLRLPFLNNWLVLNTIFPLWFSLSMLWLKIETTARQRQVALFALSAGTTALLQKVGVWPSDTVIQAIVTAWIHPTVADASKAALNALAHAMEAKAAVQ